MSNYNEFKDVFGQIEKELKIITESSNDKMPFTKLLDIASSKSKLVNYLSKEIRFYQEIRNLLEHDYDMRKAVIVSEQTIKGIKDVLVKLKNPPSIEKYFNRKLEKCSINDSIEDVVKTMAEKNFSQIPVFDEENFVGLLTNNTIARWFGTEIDKEELIIKNNPVRLVLEHEEFKENYSFIGRKSNLYEVLDLFSDRLEVNPYFDALLITEYGENDQKIIGIITKSDIPEITRIFRK